MPVSSIRFFTPTMFLYLSKRYLYVLVGTAVILSGFIYLADVIELLRRLAKKSGVTADMAFLLGSYKLPHMLMEIAPFILLLGTLISFTRLSRDRELVAMRAAGVPARRFLVPALFVCLMIGFFNLFILGPLAAVTLKKYENIESSIFTNITKGVISSGGEIWIRQPEEQHDYFIHADHVLDGGERLEGVTVFQFGPQGHFLNRFDAEWMAHKTHYWQMGRVFELSPWKEVTWAGERKLETTLTPEVIANSLSSPETMTVWQLYSFIQRLQDAGLPTQKHALYFHRLVAGPLLLIAVFLLAAPFALRFSRSHGMGQILVVGLFTGVAFYLFSNVVAAYGLSGRLTPAIAAWAPTAVAGLIGIALLLHFREE